ncbi:putative ribonuclease H-like domain-containing protein [Tanacetum coccineum]
MKAVKDKDALQKNWLILGVASSKKSLEAHLIVGRGSQLLKIRFKQVEYKGVPHPLSGDYTPREQEDIDDSLYEYGKYGPQPQSPSHTESDASFNSLPQLVNPMTEYGDQGTESSTEAIWSITGIFDSGCSGHMTGNRAHLEDYQELSKVRSVTFGGSKGSISGKVSKIDHNLSAAVSEGKETQGLLKAFRVYNLVTKRVEVNLHVNFLEEKPNVQGIGHRRSCDLMCKTEEAAELMVVSSTSLTEATIKQLKEMDALALKHLGPVPATAPTRKLMQFKASQVWCLVDYPMMRSMVAEILKKFDFVNVKAAITPMETKAPLAQDEGGPDVDLHLYRSMIGCLMYLTASRPDIICNLDRKSTTGGCQFLGRRLISWQCKKQTIVATSTTEAEYVAAASCCGQQLKPAENFKVAAHVEVRDITNTRHAEEQTFTFKLKRKLFSDSDWQFQNEVNNIRSERLARSANPLALLTAAQPNLDNYYEAPVPQRSDAPSTKQYSYTRSTANFQDIKWKSSNKLGGIRICNGILGTLAKYF